MPSRIDSPTLRAYEVNILLPMILVRNQIRDILGGETGKIAFGRIKYKFRTSSRKNTDVYGVLVHCEGAEVKVFVNFVTVFVPRRNSAYSWLRVVTLSLL